MNFSSNRKNEQHQKITLLKKWTTSKKLLYWKNEQHQKIYFIEKIKNINKLLSWKNEQHQILGIGAKIQLIGKFHCNSAAFLSKDPINFEKLVDDLIVNKKAIKWLLFWKMS